MRQEPNHVEAWEFYLQASTGDRRQLEALGDRIAISQAMLPEVRREVLDYYNYLLRRLKARERASLQRRVFMLRVALGAVLGLAIFLLRNRIPMTIPVSLLIGVAAALLLADWIRKNGQAFMPARRPVIRSYAHESTLIKIEKKQLRLLDQVEPPPGPPARPRRRALTRIAPPATGKITLRATRLPKVEAEKGTAQRRSRVKLK